MRASTSAARSATVALAALLVGSVGTTSLVLAQGAVPGPTVHTAAAEPTQPIATAAPAAPADEADLPPTMSGPAPSDYKEEPAKKDEPTIAAPATTERPSDSLNAALFDRLGETKALLGRLPAKQNEAMKAFYATRAFKPLWIAEGAFNPAGKSLMERLHGAGQDGLDPAAYPIPTLGKTEAEMADAEVKLSAAALLYARDARGGRINLASISKLVTPVLDLPTADALLAKLAEGGADAGAKLQAYNPQSPGYVALRAKLAGLRGPAPVKEASTVTGTVRIPVGPVLKVGMSDPRVPKLREFFSLPERAAGTLDKGPGEPDLYDQDVADAVAKFQRGRGLPDNGNLTRSTLVALALPASETREFGGTRASGDESEILVNMERWRWLPGELGQDYVLVNIPEYRLRVFRGGAIRDETRVIVGKTETPTPLFSGLIQYAVVNPSWYVPPSIMKTMKGTNGYEVIGSGKNIGLRQPPGPKNALGYIKFLFPNRHSVYLHDTPNRTLFSSASRAMSHGCVRVDDPFRFADAVLPDEWSAGRLKKLVGHGERTITLPEKLPVHLGYFTAFVDDDGTYRTLPDIYGYDPKMKAQLGLSTAPAAMVNRPVEPKRQIAEPVVYPSDAPQKKIVTAPRPTLHAQQPVRQASRPYRPVAENGQRASRQDSYTYGERGLWTPQLSQPQPSQPRGWW